MKMAYGWKESETARRKIFAFIFFCKRVKNMVERSLIPRRDEEFFFASLLHNTQQASKNYESRRREDYGNNNVEWGEPETMST